jgi:thioredoxin reductase (NADPH)
MDLIFPTLTDDELRALHAIAVPTDFVRGEFVYRAGDEDVPLHVVTRGEVEVIASSDEARLFTHGPGQALGDLDILTGRAAMASVRAVTDASLLVISPDRFQDALNASPHIAEKLIASFQTRQRFFDATDRTGMTIVGPRRHAPTQAVRELLQRNFIPFAWHDSSSDLGRRELESAHVGEDRMPLVVAPDGSQHANPSLREVARLAGIRRMCPRGTFDLAVIGAGPSGLSAAVYGASEGLRTIVVDQLGAGGQAGGTSSIENFFGFPAGLTGMALAERGVMQMLKFGAQLLAPARVERIEFGHGDADHVLYLDGDDKVRARTVLIATGAKWRRLEAENIERFDRAGVYYSASSNECRLCAGRKVAVIGGGNSAGQAAMFLSQSSDVELILLEDEFGKFMSEYLKVRIEANDRIHIRTGTRVVALHGEPRLDAIEVVRANDEAGQRERLDVHSLFVFIGAKPNTDWLPPEVARADDGSIHVGAGVKAAGVWPLTDREPCALETSVPRILASGDVRSGSTKRVGFAVGDGALAVTCAHQLRSKRA